MQLLEKEKKLSESLLWTLQYNAYTQFGPRAWSEKGVPFYVTSNPYTASSYAQIVYNYLKDNPPKFDEPFYIVDLGAGTGRFAYLFLKEFLALLENSPLKELPFQYVLTDIVPDNFSFWLNHPLLQPYIEQGLLDYCYYHAQSQNPLKLAISNKSVSSGNPFVLIANYFFDTIPQDLFRINDGRLEEGLITLYTTKIFQDAQDPAIINDLQWEYTFLPNEDPYRDVPKLRDLLHSYTRQLQNATFLFPIGALQSLEYFKKLSNNNMLLVAGDQGVATIEQMQAWEPRLSLHGSFSIAVSYHALASYFEQNQGYAFLTAMPDPAFIVLAGIFSSKLRHFPEVEYAYKNFIDAFDPQDYWRLGIEMEKSSISLEAILLLIKLGKFDPMNVYAFYNAIRKELPFASKQIKERLAVTICKAADNFFPVAASDGAFLANLGVLAFEMQKYQQALDLFQRAAKVEGNKPYIETNIKACLLRLQ